MACSAPLISAAEAVSVRGQASPAVLVLLVVCLYNTQEAFSPVLRVLVPASADCSYFFVQLSSGYLRHPLLYNLASTFFLKFSRICSTPLRNLPEKRKI